MYFVDSLSTGHTVSRWRGTVRGEEVASWYQPPKQPANESAKKPQIPDAKPSLGPTIATIYRTWKYLPQELVDYIMFMLATDLQSLKACSLTCKTISPSARRIIHRRIYLTSDKNWELLTVPEKQRYIHNERHGIAIKVSSEVAAHRLLPYARHLFININKNFIPANLQPFNHHFQRFDKVQELSIYLLDTPGFLAKFDTYFANFVSTLRSLHLDAPNGDTRDVLGFICQFPHLDDLTFRLTSESFHDRGTWGSESLSVVKIVPPLRGRLKLNGVTRWRGYLLQQLISLPGKRRFRFIDFRGYNSEAEQPIVDACSDTAESVSTTWNKFCKLVYPLAQQPF